MVRALAAAGARLARSTSATQIRPTIAGAPRIRPVAGLARGGAQIRHVSGPPDGKDFHTLVVFFDSDGRSFVTSGSSLVAQRLTDAVSKELISIRSEFGAKGEDKLVRFENQDPHIIEVNKESTELNPSAAVDVELSSDAKVVSIQDPVTADVQVATTQDAELLILKQKIPPVPCIFTSSAALRATYDYQNALYLQKLRRDAQAAAASQKRLHEEAEMARKKAKAKEDMEKKEIAARQEAAKKAAEEKEVLRKEQVAARKKVFAKKLKHQRIHSIYCAVEKLVSGHAPRRLLLQGRRTRYIARTVCNMKAAADRDRIRRANEKLWVYVIWDQIKARLSRWIVLCISAVYGIWVVLKNIYPFGVLCGILCSFKPVELFRIAYMKHQEYVADWKKLLEEYEEKVLKKQNGAAEEVSKPTSVARAGVLLVEYEEQQKGGAAEAADPTSVPDSTNDSSLSVWIRKFFAHLLGASDGGLPPVPPACPSKVDSSLAASKSLVPSKVDSSSGSSKSLAPRKVDSPPAPTKVDSSASSKSPAPSKVDSSLAAIKSLVPSKVDSSATSKSLEPSKVDSPPPPSSKVDSLAASKSLEPSKVDSPPAPSSKVDSPPAPSSKVDPPLAPSKSSTAGKVDSSLAANKSLTFSKVDSSLAANKSSTAGKVDSSLAANKSSAAASSKEGGVAPADSQQGSQPK